MKRRISILGDSISTFAGYTPRGFEFYDKYLAGESGVYSVEDTWWMKVIRAMDGELGYNNSISGSTISGYVSISGTSPNRQNSLAINGTPDIIFLAMGANDWAYSVLPEEFEEDYLSVLTSLKKKYPKAEIYGATILRGQDPVNLEDAFFNVDSCISPGIYSQIIRECIQKAGVHLVDLESYGIEYATIDGIHPNVEGMTTIAELWMKELQN